MNLETERLLIRPCTASDLDELEPLLRDPHVMEFSKNGPVKSREEAENYMRTYMIGPYQKCGDGLWAVTLKSGELIGFAGPIAQTIDGHEELEVGYRIVHKHWGKGYATEAVTSICDHLFATRPLKKIIAIIDPKNTRSSHLCQKLGYSLEKTTTIDGTTVCIYTKLRAE